MVKSIFDTYWKLQGTADALQVIKNVSHFLTMRGARLFIFPVSASITAKFLLNFLSCDVLEPLCLLGLW